MSLDISHEMGKRRIGILLLTIVIFGGLYWYLKNNVTLEDIVRQEKVVRSSIEEQPLRSFVIGLFIYAVVSLVPGTSGKSVVFAWLYGFWQGVTIILTGLTAAAMVMFFLSRYVFRVWIEHRYGEFLRILNGHILREGAFYLLTLRMAHFPYSIINLVSGASRVHPRTFCWTTFLGLFPGTAVFAYLGARLPSLDEVIANGVKSLLDWPLFVALAASAGFPFVFRAIARKLGILKDEESIEDVSANGIKL